MHVFAYKFTIIQLQMILNHLNMRPRGALWPWLSDLKSILHFSNPYSYVLINVCLFSSLILNLAYIGIILWAQKSSTS